MLEVCKSAIVFVLPLATKPLGMVPLFSDHFLACLPSDCLLTPLFSVHFFVCLPSDCLLVPIVSAHLFVCLPCDCLLVPPVSAHLLVCLPSDCCGCIVGVDLSLAHAHLL